MKKHFLLASIFILLSNCNIKTEASSKNICKCYRFQHDSILLSKFQNRNENIKYIIKEEQYEFTKVIADKIIFHVFKTDMCIVKEHITTGVNRFFYEFNDYDVYHFYPKNMKDSIIDRGIMNYYKYEKNSFIENQLTEDFWNIPELRMAYYDDKNKELNDIKKLEELVNKLEIFEGFSLDSKFQTDVLKELFMFTQIVLITRSYCKSGYSKYLGFLYSFN